MAKFGGVLSDVGSAITRGLQNQYDAEKDIQNAKAQQLQMDRERLAMLQQGQLFPLQLEQQRDAIKHAQAQEQRESQRHPLTLEELNSNIRRAKIEQAVKEIEQQRAAFELSKQGESYESAKSAAELEARGKRASVGKAEAELTSYPEAQRLAREKHEADLAKIRMETNAKKLAIDAETKFGELVQKHVASGKPLTGADIIRYGAQSGHSKETINAAIAEMKAKALEEKSNQSAEKQARTMARTLANDQLKSMGVANYPGANPAEKMQSEEYLVDLLASRILGQPVSNMAPRPTHKAWQEFENQYYGIKPPEKEGVGWLDWFKSWGGQGLQSDSKEPKPATAVTPPVAPPTPQPVPAQPSTSISSDSNILVPGRRPGIGGMRVPGSTVSPGVVGKSIIESLTAPRSNESQRIASVERAVARILSSGRKLTLEDIGLQAKFAGMDAKEATAILSKYEAMGFK